MSSPDLEQMKLPRLRRWQSLNIKNLSKYRKSELIELIETIADSETSIYEDGDNIKDINEYKDSKE